MTYTDHINSTESDLPPLITLSQRKCLSHLLRNIMESLSASLTLIENNAANFTPEELRSCISNPTKLMQRMDYALSNNSFCTLEKEECAWIGKYCGCEEVASRKLTIEK